MYKIFYLLLTTALIIPSHSLAFAQTGQSDVDEAENRAKIAKAKKEEFEAKFPAPNADSLTANNTVEGDLIESRIQALNAMEKLSGTIASDLTGKGISGLYVYKDSEYERIAAFNRLHQQLNLVNGEYAKCYPGGPGGALPIGALASVFLGWLPLLKTDTKISGVEFDIEDDIVWASLASNLSSHGITLGNPYISNLDFTPLNGLPGGMLNKLGSAELSSIQGACTAPYGSKNLIDKTYKNIKESLGLSVSPPTPETNKTTTTSTGAPPNTTVTETEEKIPGKDSSDRSMAFWEILRTEAIVNNMQTRNIYWIKIKNSKSGGNVRIKSTPLVDLFRSGSSVQFSGGSIAYYYVFDNYGAIKQSGVVKSYVPYTKSSKIK